LCEDSTSQGRSGVTVEGSARENSLDHWSIQRNWCVASTSVRAVR
jgi:hypothetical protein